MPAGYDMTIGTESKLLPLRSRTAVKLVGEAPGPEIDPYVDPQRQPLQPLVACVLMLNTGQ